MIGERRSPNRPYLSRSGAGRTYRGSFKRVRRIKWQEHTPQGFVMFVIVEFVIMVALISLFLTHPARGHHHQEQLTVDRR
jgi:hypothetical protein